MMLENVKSIAELIDRAAETWPDHEAIVSGEERISYSELKERADEAKDRDARTARIVARMFDAYPPDTSR